VVFFGFSFGVRRWNAALFCFSVFGFQFAVRWLDTAFFLFKKHKERKRCRATALHRKKQKQKKAELHRRTPIKDKEQN